MFAATETKAADVQGWHPHEAARFEDLKDWGDERTRLIIDFYDDLDTANVATQVHVQWPEPFSADFSERSKAEGLIAEFLQPHALVR
jgi:hypothetical protein